MTINKILVDTNAFISSYDKNDSNHKKAISIAKQIPDDAKLFVTSQIISETITVLARKLGKNISLDFIKRIERGEFNIIYLDGFSINKAFDLFKKLKSKNVSFADCTTFAIYKMYKIDNVFTFDKHFNKQNIAVLQAMD